MKIFDPNAPCQANGRYFAFPYTEKEAEIVIIPVPWDVTTSYKAGAADGPMAVLNASYQLDFFDFYVEKAWEKKISTFKSTDFEDIRENSRKSRFLAEKIIEAAESGKDVSLLPEYAKVEASCEALNEWVEENAQKFILENKKTIILGGDHSCPLGNIRALEKKHSSFSILHIDAHADLREAYEGFTYSHASIMYNAHQIASVRSIVQIGIRDLCQNEVDFITKSNKISLFSAPMLHKAMFEGISWQNICKDIIEKLEDKIYLSFDIDGLEPHLCPNTGTPVPGGLSFEQVQYLFECIRKSGKEIIGADLCEVAPNASNKKDEWDGNVGARILYQICLCM